MADNIRDINEEAVCSFPEHVVVGVPVYIVPIRWWEKTSPESGTFISRESRASVLVHHNTHGHRVYERATDCFLTEHGATQEAERRAAEYEKRQQRDHEQWWTDNQHLFLEV